MLANEMKFALLTKYDKIASLLSPGYDDREISYLLTSSQQRVFFNLYNPLANKYQQGFEMSEKRRRELDELIRQVSIFGDVKTNSTLYYLEVNPDNDYIYSIEPTSNGTTKGLAEGVKLYDPETYDPSVPNTEVAKVVAILSDTEFRVDTPITTTDGTLPTLCVISGLGLSRGQSEIHTFTTSNLKGYMLDLPPMYLYTIEEAAKTEEANDRYTALRAVTHDYIRANQRNPLRKPWKNINWRLEYSRSVHGVGDEDNSTVNTIEQYESTNKRIEIITNGTPLREYWCRYLKMPRAIVCDEINPENQINCELDESIHEMIIDEAAKLAVSITNPEMYQVKTDQRNVSE